MYPFSREMCHTTHRENIKCFHVGSKNKTNREGEKYYEVCM